MKSSLLASTLAVAGLCAVSAPAANVDMGVDFQSAYIATGATCNDGFVAMPWAGISGLKVGDTEIPLSFGFWGAIDLETYDYNPNSRSGRFEEIDLDVTLDLGALWSPDENFSWSLGYLEYDYPSQGRTRVDEEGNEYAAGNNADHLVVFKMAYDWDVSPSFVAKYRVAGPSQGKLECALGLSTGFDLTDDLSLGLSADVWYVNVDDVDGADTDSGLACADFTAKLAFQHVYAAVTYVAQIDDDVLPDGPYGYDVECYGSFGIDYSF